MKGVRHIFVARGLGKCHIFTAHRGENVMTNQMRVVGGEGGLRACGCLGSVGVLGCRSALFVDISDTVLGVSFDIPVARTLVTSEVWGKVMFLPLSVILFTGVRLHPGGGWEDPPTPEPEKRAVRILLECCLVSLCVCQDK